MQRVPFDETEMQTEGEIPGLMRGMPGTPRKKYPVTRKENYLSTILDKKSMWVPNALDEITFTPRIQADNEARAFCFDGGVPPETHEDGFPDSFGTEWVYIPVATGSMVKPGKPRMENCNDWKDIITMPSVDEWDWDAQVALSKEYISNPDACPTVMIMSGYFERLISFMDFENAAMALIDDDQKEAVHELLDACVDYYIAFAEKCIEHFDICGVHVHDDWGSQRAPFFSLATVTEMIVPHIRKFSDWAHAHGLFYEMHCCGKNEMLVPAMIDAGVDVWTPQTMNDQSLLYREYGKDIIFGIMPPIVPVSATQAEVEEACGAWVDEFVVDGAPIILSLYGALLEEPNNPLVDDCLYRMSRQKLCG